MENAAPDRPRRTQVPPAWKVARYWFQQGEFAIAPGEPACFACRWRDDRAPVYPSVSVADAWTRSKLERAHLVPHVLGGSDNEPAPRVGGDRPSRPGRALWPEFRHIELIKETSGVWNYRALWPALLILAIPGVVFAAGMLIDRLAR